MIVLYNFCIIVLLERGSAEFLIPSFQNSCSALPPFIEQDETEVQRNGKLSTQQ